MNSQINSCSLLFKEVRGKQILDSPHLNRNHLEGFIEGHLAK